jgi:hypothetical protein
MAKFLTELLKLQSLSTVFKKPSSSSLQNSILIGRWALDYDGTVQGRKVYWANMDNCGCCNDVGNVVDVKIIIKNKDETEDEDFILPYII